MREKVVILICQVPIWGIVYYYQRKLNSVGFLFQSGITSNELHSQIFHLGIAVLAMSFFALYQIVKRKKRLFPVVLMQCMGLLGLLFSYYKYITIMRDQASWNPHCVWWFCASLLVAAAYVIARHFVLKKYVPQVGSKKYEQVR